VDLASGGDRTLSGLAWLINEMNLFIPQFSIAAFFAGY
jgi:hypothetical protein